MKTFHILLFSLLTGFIYAQDIPVKEVVTEANEVIVFFDGAQITSKKSIEIKAGISILKFVDLSPFIDPKSIQIKANGEVMILSVSHQQNYLDKMAKSDELKALEAKLESIEKKIILENAYLSVIREELAFLDENRDIGGKNDQTTVINLQQVSEFLNAKLTSLKLKEVERNETLKELFFQKSDLQHQINTVNGRKEFPSGEILVKVDSKKTTIVPIEIYYVVSNAGWFPSYDIRAESIGEPVQLIYKANVKQDTKIDWTNVKLSFSSSNPNISGVAPELKTYYLDYNMVPPSYMKNIGSISGKVLDAETGEPIPFASVIVHGTTIGSVSDFDGNYSITIPNYAEFLDFSFVGYLTKSVRITGSTMNVYLQADVVGLQEVVVLESKTSAIDRLSGKVAGVEVTASPVKIRGTNVEAVPVSMNEKQTTVSFEIKTPYTIKSDNKSYAVDMEVYDLPAMYQYYCVPKIDPDAFLLAHIIDWEKYNLMQGEANIFFEDTYVGKTILDIAYAMDTLQISLGRDKQVRVQREKIKDFTTKQFIGARKEETRGWKTTVRNGKSQAINMILLDQVPVSMQDEIEVSVINNSNATQNAATGENKWEFTLEPDESKEFELIYSVKYPKSKSLIIE
jgi:hypothetical protein